MSHPDVEILHKRVDKLSEELREARRLLRLICRVTLRTSWPHEARIPCAPMKEVENIIKFLKEEV